MDFTEGSATKQIIAFSLPMLVGNIFQQFYGIADAIIVGNLIGGGALAAVGTSMTIINFLISVIIGLTTGASVLISQYYGAKQEENLSRAVSTSMIFLGVLSVVISVSGFILSPVFMRLLDVPADIFADADIYLKITMTGMLLPMFYNVYMAYMRALGDSKRPLYILIFSSVLNILFDILFVAGFGWGVAGAAWATIVSQGTASILCYLYAIKAMPVLRIKKLVFDRPIFRSILKYSIPAAIQLSITSLATLTIARLINSFGSLAVAGYTAAQRIDIFVMMPVNNVSMASSTFVAQNIGAGKEERAKQGLRVSLLFMISVAAILSILVMAFGRPLISLFVDSSDPATAEIIRVGAEYLSVMAMFYVLFAAFFAFNGFFRGVGDAVIVMILTITSLTIRTVSAHLMVSFLGMGPEAVAWSIPIGWGLCGLTAFIYYKKRLWVGKSAVKAAKIENKPEMEV